MFPTSPEPYVAPQQNLNTGGNRSHCYLPLESLLLILMLSRSTSYAFHPFVTYFIPRFQMFSIKFEVVQKYIESHISAVLYRESNIFSK